MADMTYWLSFWCQESQFPSGVIVVVTVILHPLLLARRAGIGDACRVDPADLHGFFVSPSTPVGGVPGVAIVGDGLVEFPAAPTALTSNPFGFFSCFERACASFFFFLVPCLLLRHFTSM